MASSIDFNLKGTFDTSNIVSSAESAKAAIDDMNRPLKESRELLKDSSIISGNSNNTNANNPVNQNINSINQAESQKFIESVNSLKDSQKNMTEAYKENSQVLRDYVNSQNSNKNNFEKDKNILPIDNKDVEDENEKNKKKNLTSLIEKSIKVIDRSGSNFLNNLTVGNAFGAGTSLISGMGDIANVGSGVASLLKGSGGSKALLGALGPAGIAALATTAVIGIGSAAVNKLSKPYEEKIPSMIALNGTYGALSDGKLNTELQQTRWNSLRNNRSRDDLQYSTNDYAEVMQGLSRTGYKDFTKSAIATSKILEWQQGTSADRQALINYQGFSNKYNENDTNAISNAYKSLRLSGLGNGEFSSFLEGLKSVMEEGVSKGFVKSSKEISTDLSLLAKLSNNNTLWTGEQGIEKMRRISGGIESSTSLTSATDILINKAMRESLRKNPELQKTLGFNGNIPTGMIAEFMLAEKGMSASTLPEIANQFNKTYSSDFERISAYKNAFDLNYTGAFQIDTLMREAINKDGTLKNNYTVESLEKALKDITDDHNNQSTESKYLSNQENIKESLYNIQRNAFSIKNGTLGLYAHFTKKDITKDEKTIDLIDSRTSFSIDKDSFMDASYGDSNLLKHDNFTGWKSTKMQKILSIDKYLSDVEYALNGFEKEGSINTLATKALNNVRSMENVSFEDSLNIANLLKELAHALAYKTSVADIKQKSEVLINLSSNGSAKVIGKTEN